MPVAKPPVQERFHVYVLGPNQDSRLASVGAGAIIKDVDLLLDPDAPFQLRGRGVRRKYTSALTQNGLQFLSTKFTGQYGSEDYRQQDFVNVACEMPNFGQAGCPRSVWPQPIYGPSQVLRVDLKNTGLTAITNLTFFFFGVKLFPWGSVQGYTYPERFSSEQYNYQIPVTTLGVSETRLNIPFTVQQNDFVFAAGQATAPFQLAGPRTFAEVAIVLKDEQRKPYMNDFVPLDMLFGAAGFPAVIPFNQTPSFIAPFGPGPALPGLIYPEIYIPNQHQFFYDLQRTDGSGGTNQSESFTISLVGRRVYPQ